MLIKVANGRKMLSDTVCNDLEWSLQVHKFKGDFRVFNIQGYDMILGMDWLSKLGPQWIGERCRWHLRRRVVQWLI